MLGALLGFKNFYKHRLTHAHKTYITTHTRPRK